jgi:hypothetical protein
MALIKCHLNYLFNKRTIWMLVAVVAIAFLVFTLNAAGLDEARGYRENNAIYFRTSFLTVKLLVVFFAVFLVCDFFSPHNSQYYYLISCQVSRACYFTTKLAIVAFLETGFIFLLYMSFQMAGTAFYSEFVFSGRICASFARLFVYVFFYGLLALALYQVLNNSYVIIVVFSLSILSTIANEDGSTNSVLNLFLLYLDEEGCFPYHPHHALLLIVFLLAGNLLIFMFGDCK